MSIKKLNVYLADSSLQTLSVIGQDENLSTSLNIAVQLAQLAGTQKLPMTTNELLCCCDMLNGSACFASMETPDSVSISNALNSMVFGLQDSAANEPNILNKWNIDESFSVTIAKFNTLELFSLWFAVSSFWSKSALDGYLSLSDSDDYETWAAQFVQINPTGENIKNARINAGKTQTEAAKLVGVNLRTWQKWEAEKPEMPSSVFVLFLSKVR